MKIFGTTSKGEWILCGLMVVWCLAMAFASGGWEHLFKGYAEMAVPLVILLWIYFSRRFRKRQAAGNIGRQAGGDSDVA